MEIVVVLAINEVVERKPLRRAISLWIPAKQDGHMAVLVLVLGSVVLVLVLVLLDSVILVVVEEVVVVDEEVVVVVEVIVVEVVVVLSNVQAKISLELADTDEEIKIGQL